MAPSDKLRIAQAAALALLDEAALSIDSAEDLARAERAAEDLARAERAAERHKASWKYNRQDTAHKLRYRAYRANQKQARKAVRAAKLCQYRQRMAKRNRRR